MTFTLTFFHSMQMQWKVLMKAFKVISAVMVYMFALVYQLYAVTIAIALSYAYPNQDVVLIWVGLVATVMVVWFAAGWAILSLWQPKKRDDAHLVLLMLSFMSTTAVSVAALFAAFFAMNGMLAFVALFTALAAYSLWFFIGTAVKVWKGQRTRFA